MRHARLTIVAMVVMGVAVLGFSGWTPGPSVQAAGTTVTINNDTYTPAAIVLEAGDTVTWVNKDSDKHVTATVPGAPEAFSLSMYPGKTVSFKFTKPGVYPYYSQNHGTFDPKIRRVVASKDIDMYPVATEGLIVVKGPGFTGASTASMKISGGAYSSDVAVVQAGNIAVVQAGGKVTWTNADSEEHSVVLGSGADPGKLALPAGKSQAATFAKPGIYYFYDERHATYNAKMGHAEAKKGTPTYPVAMDGYVIVL